MKKYFLLLILIVVFISACNIQNAPVDNTNENTQENIEDVQDQTNNQAINEDNQDTQDTTNLNEYEGELIAGSTTKYLRYNKADYDKALAEGKVIYLYFYATWCPICKAERPSIFAAFDEMNYNNVVGFEVHFNDQETNQEDEDIARDFGIAYQHTTIILDKNGNEAYRSLSKITKDKILEEINKLV